MSISKQDNTITKPYCEAQVGGMECGQAVIRQGVQCPKHDPERYKGNNEQLKDVPLSSQANASTTTTAKQAKRPSTVNKDSKGVKPVKKMSRADKAMADMYLENPKVKKYEAYSATHKVGEDTKLTSIYTQAVDSFKKPEVMAYLAQHDNTAQHGLVEIAEYSKEYGRTGTKEGASYAGVASSIYNSMLDRIHGKAIQQMNISSTSVTIGINLSGTPETEE